MRAARFSTAIVCSLSLFSAATAAFTTSSASAQAQLGTGFDFGATNLKLNGTKLNGRYDLKIRLFDAPQEGNRIGDIVVLQNVRISEGKFSPRYLDFGPLALDGMDRWIDFAAKARNGGGGFRALDARKHVDVVPYAQALPGVRTFPTEDSLNVILGFEHNYIDPELNGAAILGGGGLNAGWANRIEDQGHYATIVGGRGNRARGLYSTVLGGYNNSADGRYSVAAGINARADHYGSMVFNCGSQFPLHSSDEKQFLIKADTVGINSPYPEAQLEMYTGPGGKNTALSLRMQGTNKKAIRIRNYGSPYETVMWIPESGTLQIASGGQNGAYTRLGTNGTWYSSSDRRMKTDIEPLEGLLSRTMQLQPVTYHWKNDVAKETSSKDIGFIAQDVAEVFPSLVTGEDYLTLNYTGLSVAVVGAVQELKAEKDAEIQLLTKENLKLKDRLDALEAMVQQLIVESAD